MRAEHPHEAGVPEQGSDDAHREAAHLLTDEVRDRLERIGFTYGEILEWAEAYLAAEQSGDADTFLAWIERRERNQQESLRSTNF